MLRPKVLKQSVDTSKNPTDKVVVAAYNELLKEAQPREVEEFEHPLEEVLNKCLEQVTGGKGNERHGNGKDFMEQPWKHIADTHGDGFLTGQAAKKLQEAQNFEDLDRWNREMYGVITYTAMAILHRNNNA